MTTGFLGTGQVLPDGSPFETQTRMFPIVLPLPRSSISFGTGPECFLAHTGSASIVSGFRAGAFPSNVTVPVTVEAATATPGETNTATSVAAGHYLFSVTRMLGSLVIANLVSSSQYTGPAVYATLARAETPWLPALAGRGTTAADLPPEGRSHLACILPARSPGQTFSNASD